jgi:hypothetical protein
MVGKLIFLFDGLHRFMCNLLTEVGVTSLVHNADFSFVDMKKLNKIIRSLFADGDNFVGGGTGRTYLRLVYENVDWVIVLGKSEKDEVMYSDNFPYAARQSKRKFMTQPVKDIQGINCRTSTDAVRPPNRGSKFIDSAGANGIDVTP